MTYVCAISIAVLAVLLIVIHVAALRSELKASRERCKELDFALRRENDSQWTHICRASDAQRRLRIYRRLKRKRYAQGYRAGQIDAVNGVMKYELRDRPDGSRAWVSCEGSK